VFGGHRGIFGGSSEAWVLPSGIARHISNRVLELTSGFAHKRGSLVRLSKDYDFRSSAYRSLKGIAGMRDKRRMTAAEFDALKPLLNISDDRIEAARLALVNGQTLASVGEVYGWTRQAVGDAVAQVWKLHERYLESQRAATNAGPLIPPGWERVELIAPKELVEKFRAEVAKAAKRSAKISVTQGPRRKPAGAG
jgi:hypothetical protein